MKKVIIIICFLLITMPASVYSQQAKVAVLELKNEAGIKTASVEYLTDFVRDVMIESLSLETFSLMTRENIQELLPPERSMADCADAECEVEIGRMVGADYIVTGEVLDVMGGSEYRLSIKVYDCGSAAFLGGERVAGSDFRELEEALPNAAAMLGSIIREHYGFEPDSGSDFREVRGGEEGDGTWSPEFGQMSVVMFESEPSGAIVTVDGEIVCRETPCSRELAIGPARISMHKERYKEREEIINIERRESEIKLSWKLEPNFGWLNVTSEPTGLRIKIDGSDHGLTPIREKKVFPGAHRIKVTDPRYYDKWNDIKIERGKNRDIHFKLEPREGGLKVSAEDEEGNAIGADLYMDGRLLGKTPWSGKVIIGKHKINIVSDNKSCKHDVRILERKVDEVKAVFKNDKTTKSNYSAGDSKNIKNLHSEKKESDAEENDKGLVRVRVRTNKGSFTLVLYPKDAPITVENFLNYVKNDFYDETLIHRVRKDFVLQGGGYTSDNYKKSTDEPIKNEAENGLKNKKYTISSARAMKINSATSQFFINLQDNPALDHKGRTKRTFGYAVFGRVVEGFDVIDKIGRVKAEMRDGMYRPVEKVIIRSMRIVE